MERRSVDTVAGVVNICFGGNGLYELNLPGQGSVEGAKVTELDPLWLQRLRDELRAYFAGGVVEFTCPVDLEGYPPFTRLALSAAAQIPFGELVSYRWLAEQAGSPLAARAAGRAMSVNRTPLVIPCHRVVRGNGDLCGFSGGLHWKQRLITMEKKARKDAIRCR